MVANATDFHRNAAHVADEAADVGEHLSKVFVAYFHAKVLDVEYDVYVVFCE